MKSIFRLLNWFRSENGSSNASLFLFAGIASELALLIDILCIIIATGGLEYGFDPFGAGCLTGAGCLVLMVLCGVLLCREEQMTSISYPPLLLSWWQQLWWCSGRMCLNAVNRY